MSLKAKIEAVIYASEEPVTLAQLVGLLGEEAQAALDERAAASPALSLNETELDLEAAAEVDPTLAPDWTLAEGDVPDGDRSTRESVVVEMAASSSVTSDLKAAQRAERARMQRLREYLQTLLEELIAEYAPSARGLEVREVAGGYRLATKPEYHEAVRGFAKSLKPPLKLSLQALETLAVVAYKQPVTSPEISEIRGVDSSGVLGSLMARKLITTAGRKHVIGRPILYRTTQEFLLRFGLKDVAELPSIEEFEKMAGDLAEQEEFPMEGEAPDGPRQAEERLESDGERQAPDPVADEVIVDGRESGTGSSYDGRTEDPSAAEGEIQSSEASK